MTQNDSPVCLLPREDAIYQLVRLGFSVEEADRFWSEEDPEKLYEIARSVQQRLRGGTTYCQER